MSTEQTAQTAIACALRHSAWLCSNTTCDVCAVNTVGRWLLATERLYGTHGEEFGLRAPQLYQTPTKQRTNIVFVTLLLSACATKSKFWTHARTVNQISKGGKNHSWPWTCGFFSVCVHTYTYTNSYICMYVSARNFQHRFPLFVFAF